MARPAWSSGIAEASPTPVSWHMRQVSWFSNSCGIGVAPGGEVVVGVGAGAGAGVGAGAGAGAGAGVGAGAGA